MDGEADGKANMKFATLALMTVTLLALSGCGDTTPGPSGRGRIPVDPVPQETPQEDPPAAEDPPAEAPPEET